MDTDENGFQVVHRLDEASVMPKRGRERSPLRAGMANPSASVGKRTAGFAAGHLPVLPPTFLLCGKQIHGCLAFDFDAMPFSKTSNSAMELEKPRMETDGHG